jgi:hypothetical protein
MGDAVQIHGLLFDLAPLQQIAHAADDLDGTPIALVDVLDDVLDLRIPGGRGGQQQSGGFGVAKNRGERLAELVGERRGELAEHRVAIEMAQRLEMSTRLGLGAHPAAPLTHEGNSKRGARCRRRCALHDRPGSPRTEIHPKQTMAPG